MRRRHVVILFRNRLFGEAIARAIAEGADLQVTTLQLAGASRDAIQALAPDAIVIEETATPGADAGAASLVDIAPALTFVVGTGANTAEVYERHEVIEATAAAIVRRIMRGPAQGVGQRRSPDRRERGP